MIFAKLNNDPALRACPEPIQKALLYLRQADLMSMPLARHEIQGEDIFLNLMDMTTHPFEGSHPEVHQNYIDLMFWPEGGVSVWPPSLVPRQSSKPAWKMISPSWRRWKMSPS